MPKANMRHLVTVAAIAASGALAHCGSGREQPAAGDRWWSHIEYLASDELAGRQTGSEGHHKAAVYVADQFRSLGLQEAGTNGYFQPVEFETRRLIEDESSLEFVREQEEHDTIWEGASDITAAMSLLQPVTSDPLSVLIGVRNAEALIATHV